MEDFGDLAGYPAGRQRRLEFGNKFLRLDRDLAAGMTVTIEPGLYFVPAIWRNEEFLAPFADVVNRKAVDDLLHANFGGIRIEDDVVVRSPEAGGPEVLSKALPSDADAVARAVSADIKRTFEIASRIEVLGPGTLAAAFETSIKAPRTTGRSYARLRITSPRLVHVQF